VGDPTPGPVGTVNQPSHTLEGYYANEHGEHHELTAQSIGHVHTINPEITVSADIVQRICGGPHAIGIAVGWREDGGQHFGTALLEPATAPSIANAILAAVGQVISASDLDDAVAEVIQDTDMDAELAKLLGGAE
jgi:hypothetical protein